MKAALPSKINVGLILGVTAIVVAAGVNGYFIWDLIQKQPHLTPPVTNYPIAKVQKEFVDKGVFLKAATLVIPPETTSQTTNYLPGDLGNHDFSQ